MTYTIIATGPRNWTDEDVVFRALHVELDGRDPHDVVVRHGACPTGVDEIVDRTVRAFWPDVIVERYPADWDNCAPDCPAPGVHRRPKKANDIHHPGELRTYCPTAGPRRNQEMAAKGADVCLSFPMPGAFGTANCIHAAEEAGIHVRRFGPWATKVPRSPSG